MGASESVSRKKEEEDRGAFIAKSVAGIAVVGMAAWGISKMLSDSTESQEQKDAMKMKAPAMEASYFPNFQKLIEKEHEGTHGSYPNPWSPPVRGFKMNTDATFHGAVGDGSPGLSAYAGILRDVHGRWVRGFQGFIVEKNCFTAEFHGILKGLQLLDKHGYVESTLESDCQAAVKWINGEDTKVPRNKIIKDFWGKCRQLKKKNKITVVWCPKSANRCAHELAKMAFEKEVPYEEIKNLPAEIKHIVDREATMV